MTFTVSTDHNEAVGDHRQAQKMEDIERTQDRRVRLQELAEKTLNTVEHDEEIEPVAHERRGAARDG